MYTILFYFGISHIRVFLYSIAVFITANLLCNIINYVYKDDI